MQDLTHARQDLSGLPTPISACVGQLLLTSVLVLSQVSQWRWGNGKGEIERNERYHLLKLGISELVPRISCKGIQRASGSHSSTTKDSAPLELLLLWCQRSSYFVAVKWDFI